MKLDIGTQKTRTHFQVVANRNLFGNFGILLPTPEQPMLSKLSVAIKFALLAMPNKEIPTRQLTNPPAHPYSRILEPIAQPYLLGRVW